MKEPLQKIQTKGFTLIELLIVMILISISLSIIIPVLNRNSKKQVLSCARKIAALLSFATDYTLINNDSLKVIVKKNELILTNKQKIKQLKCNKIDIKLGEDEEGNFTITQGTIPPYVSITVSNGKIAYTIKYEISERNVEIKEQK